MAKITDLPKLNSVKIGNLWFKPNQTNISAIAKSVRLVTMESTEFPDYLGKAGSCTLVEWRGRLHVICTRHQLGIKNGEAPGQRILETTRFVGSQEGILTNIPTDQCLFVEGNSDEEFHDILIFRVPRTEPLVTKEEISFYPIDKFSHQQRFVSWIVGHPSSKNVIQYEPQRAAIVTQMFDCKFAQGYRSHSSHLRQFTYDTKFFEVDGFSGGAIFSMIGPNEDFKIVLDGIILRAGNGKAYIIETDVIITALENQRKLT